MGARPRPQGRTLGMFGRTFKTVTAAGLLGLAVLHADAIATLLDRALGAFRGAVNVAPGRATR